MTSFLKTFHVYVQEHGLMIDPAQEALAKHLDTVANEIHKHRFGIHSYFLSLFRKNAQKKRNGIYIHGDVGQGKSMIMRLFFTYLKTSQKKMVHFQSFMQSIHHEFHIWQNQTEKTELSDSLLWSAHKISEKYRILFLDELYMTEIVDAMIISRLLMLLLKQGVFLIISSNRAPQDLYLDGIAKPNFKEFIKLIHTHMDIYSLSAQKDYRQSSNILDSHYFFPLNEQTLLQIHQIKTLLCPSEKLHPLTLRLEGREIHFKTTFDNILFSTFEELCLQDFGPNDYLCIARTFSTIVIENIPTLSKTQRNLAKRFTWLIDQLYEHHVKLICSAQVHFSQIYMQGDESFEFSRTTSRLAEMQHTAILHMSRMS